MFSDQKSGWILKAYPYVKTLLFDDLKARHHPKNRRYQIIADITFLSTCKFKTLQPQDLSIFGPLKAGRKRIVSSLNHFLCQVNNQYSFAHLFHLACTCSLDINMIEEGFKQNCKSFLLIKCSIADYICLAKSMPETSGQVVKMKYI